MRKDKPSRTAYKVALNVVTLGAKPGMAEVLPLGLVEATAQLLVASGAVAPGLMRWSRSPQLVFVYEAFDAMMPGEFQGIGYRKVFCERQVRDGIDAGCTQVLVLGAGYDTLGWRLAPEFAGVNFFEIDHPATARLKGRGIAAMGRRENLHLLAEDLGQRQLAKVFAASELWKPAAPTIIVAEGLLMYLAPEAVRDLFAQCSAITGPGSRVVFTYLGTGADGRPDVGWMTELMMWSLHVIGEPLLWSIRPEALGGFLDDAGWRVATDPSDAPVKHGVEFYGLATK